MSGCAMAGVKIRRPPGTLSKAWIANQPTGIEGRRQMPNFHLSDQELNDLVDFFKWVSDIKTQDWPPNKAG